MTSCLPTKRHRTSIFLLPVSSVSAYPILDHRAMRQCSSGFPSQLGDFRNISFFFLICEIQNIIALTWEAGVKIKTDKANQQTSMIGDGQVSPACCSPWGRKESDTTEQLNWADEVPTEKKMTLLGLYFNFSWILCLLQSSWVWGFLSVAFSWPCLTACGILVLWAGTEPVPLALEAWSLNHWTTGKSPVFVSHVSSVFSSAV